MRRTLFFVVFAFLFFATTVHSSDSIGLKITAFGIEGAYGERQGVALVQLEIRNNTGKDKAVTIRVYEANMNAFARPARYSYVEAIKLPASGDRVLDVPLHLANNVSNSVLYAEALDQAGMPVGHAAQILKRPTEGKVIGLVCASDELCKRMRESILLSGTAEEQTRKSQDLRLIQLRKIPPHWWAYVPLDTLVLAAPTSGFSREELDGLEAFVLKGGRLVVAEKEIGVRGGVLPFYVTGAVASAKTTLAPYGDGTLVRISSVTSPEFTNYFRPYGFAISTPKELTKQFETYREANLAEPAEAWFVSWLQRRTATRFVFPGPLKLIAWMASYLCIMIVVSFLVPRRLGRPELAWLTIPILAIMFAAILYKVSAQNRPTEYGLDEARYYRLDGVSRLAIGESQLQVSAPRKGSVRVTVPGEFVYFAPQGYGESAYGTASANSVGSEITLGESWESDVFLRVWSSTNLSFEFTHRFPGTVVQVDDTHLSNATGVNFEDAILVTQEAVYLLGPFATGTAVDLAKAKKIPYGQATGYSGERFELLNTPPFAIGQGSHSSPERDFPNGAWTGAEGGATTLEDIVRGWPIDGSRVFAQTKAVFFGRGTDAIRTASLKDTAARQKSTAIYSVTYREWK